MERGSIAVSLSAPQYVKTHVDSLRSSHIPVLLHETGLVQDEDAPFCVSPCLVARGRVAWQLQRGSLDVAAPS
jgi:hypothetical protein